MERVSTKSVLFTVILTGAVFAAGVTVGRLGNSHPLDNLSTVVSEKETVAVQPFSSLHYPLIQVTPVQDTPTPERDPNDPRELIPVPGPGGSEPPPGGGPPQECGIYLYQDGQLYQLQPGQIPGQGDGSPELIPLNPVPGGPGGPSTPAPPPPPPGIES
jgi:hypothetical protein